MLVDHDHDRMDGANPNTDCPNLNPNNNKKSSYEKRKEKSVVFDVQYIPDTSPAKVTRKERQRREKVKKKWNESVTVRTKERG